jgi:hypothetical protein
VTGIVVGIDDPSTDVRCMFDDVDNAIDFYTRSSRS